MISKTEGTDTWAYSWDAENQLTRVEKNGAEVARFGYDPNGRRVEKATAGGTTFYTYDGFNILREARGATALRYIHGPDVDEPLAVEDGTALLCVHQDALGSMVGMTNSAGAVELARQYDVWGNLESGASDPGFAFTGREWDPETGLYYYRSRYYDPELGRFISEDLIRFDGGENFYAYVRDSPPNSADPSGLCGLGGCSATMGPRRPDPQPPVCMAPKDYPCPCPLVETFDEELLRACLCSLGAPGGQSPPVAGAAYYAKKCPIRRTRMREKAEIIGPQGARACAFGALAIVASLPKECREAARRCVPAWELK
jgi:RHS repeat-associated protein